jgi:hypothetical protein
MNQKMLDAFENSLQRMDQGETLDSALAHYPDLAGQLRPLLVTARRASSLRNQRLPVAALSRGRARGLSLAVDLRQKKGSRLARSHFLRLALTAISVIAILVMSGNGLLIASAKSLPGDTLYPLKRTVETTQLSLVTDPAEKQALQLTFSQRRVEEAKSLIDDHRVETVQFNGVVTGRSDGEWVISGIPVQVSQQTELDQTVSVGDEVQVSGSTNSDGEVSAVRLSPARTSGEDGQQSGHRGSSTVSPGSPTSSYQNENQGGDHENRSNPTPTGTRTSGESTPAPQHTPGEGGDH